jgi:hypothetical protein
MKINEVWFCIEKSDKNLIFNHDCLIKQNYKSIYLRIYHVNR